MIGIILASGSEGRKELFEQYFNSDFSIRVSNVPEEDLLHLDPQDMVQQLAIRKSQKIAQDFFNAMVCAFDTTVVCESKNIGKPSTLNEAHQMLSFLNNKVQTVMTGYSFEYKNIKRYGVEKADLILSMSEEQIREYIVKHPVTKFAGAYAIQKKDTNISFLSGSVDTVIGAPMNRVLEFLKEIPVDYSVI